MQPNDLQHETMRVYKVLVDKREDWSGGLVLCCGAGCAASGIPAAVSIAGGTTLAIDSDAAAMKSAMRAGYLDFVVNTLDEALRTLKNEIRQKRPLSVGLISNVETTLAEMVERGLQPDLELVPSGCQYLNNSQLQILRARGMSCRILVSEADLDGRPISPTLLILNRKRHYECFFPATDAARLREIDARLLTLIPAEDIVRRRWIERIPKYLRDARTGGRWMWLSEEEQDQIGE
jgi:urocanate hydratase